MKEKEILEGNKLIAEFMKYRWKTDKHWVYEYYSDSSYEGEMEFTGWWMPDIHVPILEGLEFHSSWDWLMPVVEKIENLEVPTSVSKHTSTFSVIIYNNYCSIEYGGYQSGTIINFEIFSTDTSTLSKIEIIYKEVIKFIKWYNKEKFNDTK